MAITTTKRNALRKIEENVQRKWFASSVFHQNTDANKQKFFASFYNGRVVDTNLSYGFHVLKADFATSYSRLKGKNSLIPITVHYSAPLSNQPEKILSPSNVLTCLQSLGVGIDDSNLFSTQDDLFYQSFILWVCEYLKSTNKLHFGTRFEIFSPKLNRRAGNYDRSTGLDAFPKYYFLVKHELCLPFPPCLCHFEGRFFVYLLAHSKRPELLHGETNVWADPNSLYGVYQINETDVFICTAKVARNLSFQGYSSSPQQVTLLYEFMGDEMIGFPVRATCSLYPFVYVLPLEQQNSDIGVSTSVPSAEPFDYLAFKELETNHVMRIKYKLKQEMFFDHVPVIKTTTYGEFIAAKVCASIQLTSSSANRIEYAEDLAFVAMSETGVMLNGEYKGLSFKLLKQSISISLAERGFGFEYAQPSTQTIDTKGEECVVSRISVWEIKFGNQEWKNEVLKNLNKIDVNDKEIETMVNLTGNQQISRNYGIGIDFPFLPGTILDANMESAIFTIYQPIVHLIKENKDLCPTMFTYEVWNYVFLNGKYPEKCKFPEEFLQKLRFEFEYWYGLDLYITMKETHLAHTIPFLFVNTALFKDKFLPKKIVATSSHILIDNIRLRMSKLPLSQYSIEGAINMYSADAVRLSIACAASFNPSFSTSTASTAVLRLHSEIQWIEEILTNINSCHENVSLLETLFESQINRAIVLSDQNYANNKFKEALQYGCFNLHIARDAYRSSVDKMNKNMVLRFIEVQALLVVPIIPHFSEHVWKLLGKSGFARTTKWPDVGPIDENLIRYHDNLENIKNMLLSKKEVFFKKNKLQPTKAKLFVANSLPLWMQITIEKLKSLYNENKSFPSLSFISRKFKEDEIFNKNKEVMPFVAKVKQQVESLGEQAFEQETTIKNEKEILEIFVPLLKKSLGVHDIEVCYNEDENANVKPGFPTVLYFK